MGKAKTQPFKQQFSLGDRVQESQDIIAKYPDRVPVVVERYTKTDLPEMEKKKFLVPRDMSVGQFIHILGGRLHLAPGKALFVFVKNTLPQTSSLIETVYDSFKDEDGFLYMCYSSEKTLGFGHTKIDNPGNLSLLVTSHLASALQYTNHVCNQLVLIVNPLYILPESMCSM